MAAWPGCSEDGTVECGAGEVSLLLTPSPGLAAARYLKRSSPPTLGVSKLKFCQDTGQGILLRGSSRTAVHQERWPLAQGPRHGPAWAAPFPLGLDMVLGGGALLPAAQHVHHLVPSLPVTQPGQPAAQSCQVTLSTPHGSHGAARSGPGVLHWAPHGPAVGNTSHHQSLWASRPHLGDP